MRRLGPILLALALAVSGCATGAADSPPAAATEPTSPAAAYTAPVNPRRASPSCFPYHDPTAQGPGPSLYSFEVQGEQPFYPGAGMRVVGSHWPGTSASVELLLLPQVENAMWYGTQPDLVRCLGSAAVDLGRADVKDGAWTWAGTLPDLAAGTTPVLLAVDQSGTYLLTSLVTAQPYTLTVDAAAGKQPGAIPQLAVGKPFRLTGAGLPDRTQPVRIRLNYQDDQGGDWVLLGAGQFHGDRLETDSLTVPATLTSLGNRAPKVPGTYSLIITNDQRPYEIYYTLSIDLVP